MHRPPGIDRLEITQAAALLHVDLRLLQRNIDSGALQVGENGMVSVEALRAMVVARKEAIEAEPPRVDEFTVRRAKKHLRWPVQNLSARRALLHRPKGAL